MDLSALLAHAEGGLRGVVYTHHESTHYEVPPLGFFSSKKESLASGSLRPVKRKETWAPRAAVCHATTLWACSAEAIAQLAALAEARADRTALDRAARRRVRFFRRFHTLL